MARNYYCDNERRNVAHLSVHGRDLLGYRYSQDADWHSWRAYLNISLDRELTVCAACYEEYKYGP